MFSFIHKYKNGQDISCYVGPNSCWHSNLNRALKFPSTREALEFVAKDFATCKRTKSGSTEWTTKDLLEWMIEYDVELEFI